MRRSAERADGACRARSYRRRAVPLGLLVALAVQAFTSCQASTGTARALPPSPHVVVVTMDEYAFAYDPTVPAGRVVFEFINVGEMAHRPSLLPLSESVPPIQEQLRGSQREAVSPFASVPTLKPGEKGTFAVNLAPGQRYALICFATNPDGQSHALLGMSSEFRSGGSRRPEGESSATETPLPDQPVETVPLLPLEKAPPRSGG